MSSHQVTQRVRRSRRQHIQRVRPWTYNSLIRAVAFVAVCFAFGSMASAQVTEDWRASYDTSIGAPPNLFSARDVGDTLAFDAAGNIFVAGTALAFNTGYPNHIVLKYDSGGNRLWEVSLGLSGTTSPSARMGALKVDALGNVHGIFTSGGGFRIAKADVFKLDTNGSIAWLHSYDDSSADIPDRAIALDVGADGSVYFLIDSFLTIDISGNGAHRPITQKFDSGGTLLWQVVVGPVTGGSGEEPKPVVASDALGNAYVLMDGKLQVLASADGAVLCDVDVEYWWESDGTGGGETPEFRPVDTIALSVAADGTSTVVGNAIQRHWFWNGVAWESEDRPNVFTAKYDSSCNLIWSDEYGTFEDSEEALEIEVDESGDIQISWTNVDGQHLHNLRFASNGTGEVNYPYHSYAGGGVLQAVHLDGDYSYVIDKDVLYKHHMPSNTELWTAPSDFLRSALDTIVLPNGKVYLAGSVHDGESHQAPSEFYADDLVLIQFDNDLDDDGFTDDVEMSAGSDPNDPASTPLTVLGFGGTGVLNRSATTDTGAETRPRIASDGRGKWLSVWTSSGDIASNGTEGDIFVRRATWTSGTEPSWSAPALLHSSFQSDVGVDSDPSIAGNTTSRPGRWIAVWSSTENVGKLIGTDPDILFSVSTDDGARWSTPAALGTNAATDSGADTLPMIVALGPNRFLVVWVSTDSAGIKNLGTDQDILFSRTTDGGLNWSPPEALNSTAVGDTGTDKRPSVRLAGTTLIATWHSNEAIGGSGADYDVFFSRSTDSGASWSPSAILNSNGLSDSAADAYTSADGDGSGNWVAVWYSLDDLDGSVGTDRDIFVARSIDDGVSWLPTTALSTSATDFANGDFRPEVSNDRAGNWLVTWYSQEDIGGNLGTDADILLARSTDIGVSWTVPVALNESAFSDARHDTDPHVATDARGRWIVVWSSLVNFEGTGTDRDILYVSGIGPDSDGDGLPDGAEVNIYASDPEMSDTDGDGLPDGDEVNLYGTSPILADTDGDGFDDPVELAAGSDPNDSSSTPTTAQVPAMGPSATVLLILSITLMAIAMLRRRTSGGMY